MIKQDKSKESETTIRIKRNTRDLLEAIGSKGQTYNDVINDLVDFKAENEKLYVTNTIQRSEERYKKHKEILDGVKTKT